MYTLALWLKNQKTRYKISESNEILLKSDLSIRNEWINFIDKYQFIFQEYFTYKHRTNTEKWLLRLIDVEEYIIINNKIPSRHDTNLVIKALSNWIDLQNDILNMIRE